MDPFCHVAIVRLAVAVEDEARALTVDLGGSLYDHRMKLATGLPALILTTRDAQKARTVAMRAQQRGNGVFLCSSEDVVPAAQMVHLREFELAPDALVSLDTSERLAWSDIHALVRTTYRAETPVKAPRPTAPRTGGPLIAKKLTSTHTMDANEIEAALYIFGPPRTTPWLLRQRHALYGALGAAVTAQSITNFERTLQELRTRAPHAGFKEGLATRKQNELDLLAHIVARTSGLSPP